LTLRRGDFILPGPAAAVSTLDDCYHLKGTIEKCGAMELRVKAET